MVIEITAMKSSKVDLKVCGICGDKALGYNFNAITCESCKAFFRRNALITKPLKCPFHNQCDITTITRRFCQKCRLDKCFAIGMCKDLIMSEKDKVAKRQKIEENKVRKQGMDKFKSNFKKIKREIIEADSQHNESQYNTDSDSNNTSLDQYSPQNISTNTSLDSVETCVNSPNDKYQVSSSNDIPNNILDPSNLIHKSVKDKNSNCVLNLNTANGSGLRQNSVSCTSDLKSSCNDKSLDSSDTISSVDISKVMKDVQSVQPDDCNPIESILCEAIKLEYQAFSSIAQNHSNSRELNDAERAKINELIVANKAFLTPVDQEFENLIGISNFEIPQQKNMDGTSSLVDVINLTTIYVRRLIKMAKKIGAFRNMCQEDQLALLKGGCTELMLLRSAMTFDSKRKSWQIPHSVENLRLNVDILKLAKGNIYIEHEKFIKTFSPLWKDDENIILILCMVLLFSPDRPKVVHQDVIKLEQNSYYYLLRRYLESIHAGCEAKSTFLKLMQKITELRKLNDELISVYLNINPSHVEPLLIEVFDLNK